MTEFENTLRDYAQSAYEDYRDDELPTPAELDAYRLGATHAIEEAAGLFLVELALAVERAAAPEFDLSLIQEEVRTSFAVEWEQGTRPAGDLHIVDDVLDREVAVYDAMADCE